MTTTLASTVLASTTDPADGFRLPLGQWADHGHGDARCAQQFQQLREFAIFEVFLNQDRCPLRGQRSWVGHVAILPHVIIPS